MTSHPPHPPHSLRVRSDLDTCSHSLLDTPLFSSSSTASAYDHTPPSSVRLHHLVPKSIPSPSHPSSFHPHTLPSPTTPNSQLSEQSTEGSRSIPYADVYTLARLLSAADRDSNDPRLTHNHLHNNPAQNPAPPRQNSLHDFVTAHSSPSPLPPVTSESTVSDTSCPDVQFRPISPLNRRRPPVVAVTGAPPERAFRPVARAVSAVPPSNHSSQSPSPSLQPPSSSKISSPFPLVHAHRDERKVDPLLKPPYLPSSSLSPKPNKSTPALRTLSSKRAFTTMSDSLPQPHHSSDHDPNPPISLQRSFGRALVGPAVVPSVSSRRISWHRGHPADSDAEPLGQAESLETAVLRFDSAASDSASLLLTLPSRRQRSDGLIGRTARRHHIRTSSQVGIDAINSISPPDGLTSHQFSSSFTDANRGRRRSSYLTMAFLRRKASVSVDDNEHSSAGYPLVDQSVVPVHSYTSLVPFGHSDVLDNIILYTNSVRAELNDLIFLTTILQRYCSAEASVRKKHRNIQLDFEIWFSRFAQYTGLVLFGIEEFMMTYFTEVLAQRDVMLSRSTADIEAEGVSRVQAWSRASKRIFERMDRVRSLLNDVDNRVMWLRRNRQYQEDLGRPDAWLDMFAAVGRLVPGMVELLNDIDENVRVVLSLKVDFRRGMRKLYRQFATLLSKEGSPPLGWSAIVTLTRWIEDRKMRNENIRALSRAAKLSVFSRYRADNSHHTIVKLHHTMAAEK